MKNLLYFALGVLIVLGGSMGVFYASNPVVTVQAAEVNELEDFVATRKFDPTMVMIKPGEEVSPTLVMVAGGKKEVHRWIPSTLVANVGDTVIMRIKNVDFDCAEAGEPEHGFSMAAFGIDIPEIPAGSEEVITIKPDKPGIYTFYCGNADCDEDHDQQVGQLIVLDKGGKL